MATKLGSSTKPTYGQEYSGLNTLNQQALKLTLPSGGPWNITKLGAWMAGKDAAVTTYLCVWNSSGTLIGQSASFSATGHSFALGNSDNYEKDVTSPPEVAGGSDVWVGWSRNPSGSAQWGYNNDGVTHRDDTQTGSYPGSLSGYVNDSRGSIGAYLYYELANSVPDAPTLTSPSNGSTITDTTPTLAFTHNDPDSDPCASYDIQVDTTTGNGVTPDWSGLAYSATDATSGISGNNITHTTSALSRGSWYAWRARTNDGTGDGAWSSPRYFYLNDLPDTPTNRDPGSSDFAYIHNLGETGVWLATAAAALPRFKFTYTDPDGDPMSQYQIRIYTASSGGSDVYGAGPISLVKSSGSTVTHDSTYYMLNRDQASNERWWTVEVWDSHGESSGESARTAFKVDWGQALYEYNPGAGSSDWNFANSGVAGGTQASFIFRSATSSGGESATGKTSWKTAIGSVTVQAWMQVLVRLASNAPGTNPALGDMTFTYLGSATTPDRWTGVPGSEWALTTDERRFGAKAIQCVVASGTAGNRYLYPFRKTSGDDIQVSKNTQYTFSAFVKTPPGGLGGGNDLRLKVARTGTTTDFIDPTYPGDLDSPVVTDTSAYPDGWQRIHMTFTTESVEAVRPMLLYTRNSGVNETFLTDAWKVEEGTVATAWTPGFIGVPVILDANGVQVDGSAGGIMRMRGTSGGSRDLVELGASGLVFGGTEVLDSPSANELRTDAAFRAEQGLILSTGGVAPAASAGIGFGSNTQLVRYANGQLILDQDGAGGGSSNYYRVRATGGTIGLVAELTADTTARFIAGYTAAMAAAGIELGSGSASRDVNLYRGGSNQLKTDDTLNAVLGLQANGNDVGYFVGDYEALLSNQSYATYSDVLIQPTNPPANKTLAMVVSGIVKASTLSGLPGVNFDHYASAGQGQRQYAQDTARWVGWTGIVVPGGTNNRQFRLQFFNTGSNPTFTLYVWLNGYWRVP